VCTNQKPTSSSVEKEEKKARGNERGENKGGKLQLKDNSKRAINLALTQFFFYRPLIIL
jgi:hypothetical protein